MRKKIYTFVLLLAITPFEILQAATVTAPTDFKGFVKLLTGLISMLVVVVITFAFLAFVWGVIKSWIIQGGSEEGVENGKKIVLASVIGFVVMLAVWGIVNLLKGSFFGS